MIDESKKFANATFKKLTNIWLSLGDWSHGVVYLIIMTPFALFRHVRIHGDEKVYVGQALEMLRAGHYWQQLQFGEVNYIKGPLHYLFLILGHRVFGFTMLATVYMNLVLAATAVVALRKSTEKLIPEQPQLWAIPAWIFASSGAFVLFTLSSQMDSLLTSLYALVLSLCVLAKHSNNARYLFQMWVCVGLAGALKSPLHSCLLGLSVVLYHFMKRSLWTNLFSNAKRWFALCVGIFVCGLGYALPFLLDRERWLGTYMFREQIDRPRFSDPASQFIFNNFVFHLFPWSLLGLFSAVLAFQRFKQKKPLVDELFVVGISFLLPTFLFFFGLGYLASWYGLPLIPALSLLCLSQLKHRRQPFLDLAKAVLPWSVVLLVVTVIAHGYFYDGTSWWSWSTTLSLAALATLSIATLEAVASARVSFERLGVFVGVGSFWLSALGLTAVLGEAELSDLRSIMARHPAALNYNNIRKENYSEWGYMAYMIGQPTYFSNTFEELLAAAERGQWLVFTKREELDEFRLWLKSSQRYSRHAEQFDTHLWRRWPRNAQQLRQIWSQRESTENLWDKSTRHFYVVRMHKEPVNVMIRR